MVERMEGMMVCGRNGSGTACSHLSELGWVVAIHRRASRLSTVASGFAASKALASRRHAMYVSCWTADASAFVEGFTVVLDVSDSSERLAREGNVRSTG